MTLRPESFDSDPVNGYVASIRSDDESGRLLVRDLARNPATALCRASATHTQVKENAGVYNLSLSKLG